MPNAFGFSTAPSDGGDFTPIVKYDARAGRMFRVDRTQDSSGNFASEAVDVTQTFKAIFGFDHIETGWVRFASGIAPNFKMVPIGNELPARPSAEHKNGVRLMIRLAANCCGDKPIREMAGTAKAFLAGIEAAYEQYQAEKAEHPGELPIMVLEGTKAVKSGAGEKSSTNYQPTFVIVGWKECGDLGNRAAMRLDGSPPATGSTRAGPPKVDDDFG
ncbi:hypothetical protein [Bradyrhizobium sp. CCBAU 051011]|uniref:hypothetical protein n=1 Tax=Bradyrhizobium sp. CCBAU 051011 TaxID=858422 RepID=UPI00137A856C|nr:hypothetical protein [Bradyrhizobium sp. CCBAU 051011]